MLGLILEVCGLKIAICLYSNYIQCSSWITCGWFLLIFDKSSNAIVFMVLLNVNFDIILWSTQNLNTARLALHKYE